MTDIRRVLTFTSFALLAACGGQSFTGGEGDAGKGGNGSGGSGVAGRATAGSGTGATAGNGTGGTGTAGSAGSSAGSSGNVGTAGTGGSACCAAAPTCAPGELEVPSSAQCYPGGLCYSVTTCCSTIWCTWELAQCDAYPICDEGDWELRSECPPVGECYSRSVCGFTVYCLDRCNPATDYNRQYVTTEAAECEGLEWECAPGTTRFTNECGCGCEQPRDCPALFACSNPNRDRAAPLPNTGGTGSGVPRPEGGTAGIAGGTGELPLCTAEDLARCPFSKTY